MTKDAKGSAGAGAGNPVLEAVRRIKVGTSSWRWRVTVVLQAEYPGLTVACDVCLCPYTSHGHCGVLTDGRGGRVTVARSSADWKHSCILIPIKEIIL